MKHIRVRFEKLLEPAREKLDLKANEILNDLVSKLPMLERIVPIEPDSEFLTSCIGFQGKDCSVVIASYELALFEFAKEGNQKLVEKNRFATFAENRLYCEGTDGCLLELLIRYGDVKTDKAIISSTPDVCVWRKDKASLKPEDLLDSYGDERAVVTTLVFDSGFIAFTFQKKVKPLKRKR